MKLFARLALAAARHGKRGRPSRRPDRRPHVPLSGRVSRADRLRVRGRHLDRAEGRRRGHPAQLTGRRGDVPALLARREDHRLQRQLRRQPRRVRRRRHGRHAGAAHAPPDGRPADRLASRRPARAVRVEPRERAPALQPVLPGAGNRRAAREARGALRRVRHVRGRRPPLRVHAAVAGLPHVEALPRRLGLRHLAVRPADHGGVEPDEGRRQRRPGHVVRRHDLLPLGPRAGASGRTSGRWIRKPAPRGR